MLFVNVKHLILDLPRGIKRSIVMFLDSSLVILSVWISYYLRVGAFLPIFERVNEHYLYPACIVALVTSIPIFIMFRFYKTIFRYSGSRAMITLLKAIGVYSIIYITVFTIIGIDGVPRTIGIIQPIILLLLICFLRIFALYWLSDMYVKRINKNAKKNALIFGAGNAGRQLMIALEHSEELNVRGFIDTDDRLQGNQINGLTVYNPKHIEKIIRKLSITKVMLAKPKISLKNRENILALLNKKNVTVHTIPSYTDLISGSVSISDIRELSINDILGRRVILPNVKLMQVDISGKVVLITGAGGTIGGELCRQILYLNPKKIILFDHSEYALYSILKDLKHLDFKRKLNLEIIAIIGSVTDKERVYQVLQNLKPDTIFHAAAYKHVPILEGNKLEGIKNNVFGTLDLVKASINFEVKKFVLISTDKAVRPTNLMGASKRLSEMILQALSKTQKKTTFAIVRFGNVLDSSGSVVPLFRSQIKSGGPLTLTHRDITRYFMTISEAAQLVIQASAMTKTQLNKDKLVPIYLLDMGTPVKIYDLACRMIKLSGLKIYNNKTRDGDIEIQISGLRAGEKLHEELLIDSTAKNTSHPKIKYAEESFLPWPKLNKYLTEIRAALKVEDEKTIILTLCKLVSGFKANKLK